MSKIDKLQSLIDEDAKNPSHGTFDTDVDKWAEEYTDKLTVDIQKKFGVKENTKQSQIIFNAISDWITKQPSE